MTYINYLFAFIFFMILAGDLYSQNLSSNNVSVLWDKLDKEIINGTIDDADAEDLMEEYEPYIVKYFKQQKGKEVVPRLDGISRSRPALDQPKRARTRSRHHQQC